MQWRLPPRISRCRLRLATTQQLVAYGARRFLVHLIEVAGGRSSWVVADHLPASAGNRPLSLWMLIDYFAEWTNRGSRPQKWSYEPGLCVFVRLRCRTKSRNPHLPVSSSLEGVSFVKLSCQFPALPSVTLASRFETHHLV